MYRKFIENATADCVYGPCLTLSLTNKLPRIQNICTRFITNSSVYEPITPSIRQLNLLKLNERRFVHFTSLLNNVVTSHKLRYLFDKLLLRNDIHSRNLRYVNDNNLPFQLHDKSKNIVKNQLKALILSNDLNINFSLF